MKTILKAVVVPLLALAYLAPLPASAQYFNYDPDNPAHQAPITKGEKPVIPLDTEDPGYNVWQTPRKDLGKGRKPGPMNIQRFPGGPGWHGIPSFFKLPVAPPLTRAT